MAYMRQRQDTGGEHEPHPLAKEFRDVSEALKELQTHVSNLEN